MKTQKNKKTTTMVKTKTGTTKLDWPLCNAWSWVSLELAKETMWVLIEPAWPPVQTGSKQEPLVFGYRLGEAERGLTENHPQSEKPIQALLNHHPVKPKNEFQIIS